MINKFKYLLKRLIGLEHRVTCYSQEGEDLILERLFGNQPHGFYVDIGAHHPMRLSNTYLLYLRGWHGINIDAMPGSMIAFNRMRPRDLNLEVGISQKERNKEYFIFQERALNTFNSELANKRISNGHKYIRSIQVVTRDINSVLEEYLPLQTQIDLLNIDIEGLDEVVLSTLDFIRFMPMVIVNEALESNVSDVFFSSLANKLINEGYSLFSKLFNSCIWISNKFSYGVSVKKTLFDGL